MHRCVAAVAQNKILMALDSLFLPDFSTLSDCSSNYWEHTLYIPTIGACRFFKLFEHSGV